MLDLFATIVANGKILLDITAIDCLLQMYDFVFQLSENKCNWIIKAGSSGSTRFFVCTGNYQWQSYDLSKTNIASTYQGTTIGINYLQPC